jgi:hypothetical protein
VVTVVPELLVVTLVFPVFVLVDVLAGFVVLPVFDVPLVVFESEPPQAASKSAQEMESASVTKILLAI